MERLADDRIALTEEELDNIRTFIWNSLYSDWDQYTNNVICSDSLENGMRRMNPEMYDFMTAINSI